MVKYIKKGNQREYTEEDRTKLLNALKRPNGKTKKQICAEHNVPLPTAERWQSYNKKSVLGTGKTCVFTKHQENLLCVFLVYCAAYGFPQTEPQFKDMVQSFVSFAKIKNPFKNGKPGRYWIEGFKKRNHNALRLRQREGLAIGRAKALTVINIYEFFTTIYKPIYDQHDFQFKPQCIWNLDETAFQAQKSTRKVFVGSVSKNSYSLTSNATKSCFTTLFCGSAAGVYLPPFTIYKSKVGLTQGAVTGGVKGAAYGFSKNGWMEGPTFQTWFTKTFIPTIKKVDAHSHHLIFYDGHSSHLTYEAFRIAKENNVHVICLPPNSSHATQPLDVGVFKAVKALYRQIVEDWWRESNYKNICRNVFPLLLKQLWDQLDPTWLVNGFRKTGLYPYNEKALDDKTLKSLTDEDAIFKKNMRRKPDKSEKAVIKAVKESLKPRVNAAVEAAEKKRNNLKRIQCLSGEVMTEDSAMA